MEERVKEVALPKGSRVVFQGEPMERDLGKRREVIDEVRTWGRQTRRSPGHRWSG